jgi:hypothetical protein
MRTSDADSSDAVVVDVTSDCRFMERTVRHTYDRVSRCLEGDATNLLTTAYDENQLRRASGGQSNNLSPSFYWRCFSPPRRLTVFVALRLAAD